MTGKEAYLAFSTFPAIGPQRFKLLREYFGSAKRAWEAPEKELRQLGVGEKLLAKFIVHRKAFSLEKYEDRLGKLGVEYVTVEEFEYPERLKKIDDAPFLLYARRSHARKVSPGEAKLAEMAEVSVAVVGTRKISSYGRDVTERLVAGLVDAGVTIVSGLALGVDAVAHKTVVECGGKTIAVMAGGLDKIYPTSNTQLARQIVESGGVLMSEYPLGVNPRPEYFPYRNRIESGMSLGVVVIEGAIKSGTMVTAALAARQGRDVFAVPGPINSPLAAGPHMLIRNGAKLVEKAEDILEELDISTKHKVHSAKRILPDTEEEKTLINFLENEGVGLDELVRMSGMETGTVLSTLTGMEMKGMVRNVGGVYVKA
ncbi:MAG: DNA protecting protein DprA [Candidatus Blackburnbacteria bacterium RIFCSPHIGHO2_01_FULL_43_15b]|uniref:DNA protecting protein DprA n=1 Tax=Candidatus Blackburnbacteria bacterium RIFCSPHIGHO2_01_FULL_43_15b TaxID=1797513 RepID=A0A1G1UYJ3_9BACT|nr:MAG: DNA protecting protein DprA [Candidatus Blackburnbacteria bacterium RIFCSPHIGHO2_01_FULL_43_15b]